MGTLEIRHRESGDIATVGSNDTQVHHETKVAVDEVKENVSRVFKSKLEELGSPFGDFSFLPISK